MDVTAPGRQLHAKFVALGDMRGKSAAEIIASVGSPTSANSVVSDRVLHWHAPGCHMALQFDANDHFQDIAHCYVYHSPSTIVRPLERPRMTGSMVKPLGIVLGLAICLGMLIKLVALT